MKQNMCDVLKCKHFGMNSVTTDVQSMLDVLELVLPIVAYICKGFTLCSIIKAPSEI
jgi:hypothetical protein